MIWSLDERPPHACINVEVRRVDRAEAPEQAGEGGDRGGRVGGIVERTGPGRSRPPPLAAARAADADAAGDDGRVEPGAVHPRARGPRAQPQEHRCEHPAGPAGGDHRALRFGEVVAGVRHDLRRGAAEVHGVAVGVCAPVSGSVEEAGCGRHRGAAADDRDRAAERRVEPALDRGNDDGDLRLSAALVCAVRDADVLAPDGGEEGWDGGAAVRAADLGDEREPDRGCGDGVGWSG